jgi:uncharacterized protein (TIGR02217 family)
MSFLETPRFPTGISLNSSGGPGFKVSIIGMDSGQEERVARWSSPRRKYDAQFENISPTDEIALRDFFTAINGPTTGFRYKDWLDYSTDSSALPQDSGSTPAHTDVQIGVGDGSTTQFQLIKTYTAGAFSKTRNITKPVADTTLIGIDGVNQESGWSVDTTTGLVTITPAPSTGEVVTAGCDFDVPVRFGEDLDYLMSAITGYAAVRITGVTLIEILDADETADDFFYGGAASYETLTSDLQLSVTMGRVVRVATTTGGLNIKCEDPTNLPNGGIYHQLINTGSTDFDVDDENDSSIGTLAGGADKELWLTVDQYGNKEWKLL